MGIPKNHSQFMSIYNKYIRVLDLICEKLPKTFGILNKGGNYRTSFKRYMLYVSSWILDGLIVNYLILSQEPYNHKMFPKEASAFSYSRETQTNSAIGMYELYQHIKYSDMRISVREKILDDGNDWNQDTICKAFKESYCSLPDGIILLNISTLNKLERSTLGGKSGTYEVLETRQMQVLVRCILRMGLYNARKGVLHNNLMTGIVVKSRLDQKGYDSLSKELFGTVEEGSNDDPFNLLVDKGETKVVENKKGAERVRSSLRLNVINFGQSSEILTSGIAANIWNDVVDVHNLAHPINIQRSQKRFKTVENNCKSYVNLSKLVKATTKDTKIANTCNTFIDMLNKLVYMNKKFSIHKKSNKITSEFYKPRVLTSLFTDHMSKNLRNLDDIKLYISKLKTLRNSGAQSQIDPIDAVIELNEKWVNHWKSMCELLKVSESSYPSATSFGKGRVLYDNTDDPNYTGEIVKNNYGEGGQIEPYARPRDSPGMRNSSDGGVAPRHKGGRARLGPNLSMVYDPTQDPPSERNSPSRYSRGGTSSPSFRSFERNRFSEGDSTDSRRMSVNPRHNSQSGGEGRSIVLSRRGSRSGTDDNFSKVAKQNNRPDKINKPSKSKNVTKVDKMSNSAKLEKSTKLGKSDKSGKLVKSAKSSKSGKSRKSSKSERSTKSRKSRKTGKSGKSTEICKIVREGLISSEDKTLGHTSDESSESDEDTSDEDTSDESDSNINLTILMKPIKGNKILYKPSKARVSEKPRKSKNKKGSSRNRRDGNKPKRGSKTSGSGGSGSPFGGIPLFSKKSKKVKKGSKSQ